MQDQQIIQMKGVYGITIMMILGLYFLISIIKFLKKLIQKMEKKIELDNYLIDLDKNIQIDKKEYKN